MGNTPSGNNAGQDQNTPQQSSTPAAPADVSFEADAPTVTYKMQVVYLPDYSHPQAVTMNTGFFGTSSMSLTLQDGWMLTNVSANGDDSQIWAVLQAAVQAVTGKTSSATQAAASGAVTPPGSPAPVQGQVPPAQQILKPGFYGFDYVRGDGSLSVMPRICPIAFFTPQGTVDATTDQGSCSSAVPRPANLSTAVAPAVTR
jgi:hypothetical protein